ncbi:hypothetical protein [Virgibacillus pantothenticus]|uniref:hypothetical protein n=1 Tax=Virgibacillus pantothenticus TaxID=1473 RepID=UPI0009571FDB|nr:hypothetical protein [Virgibacillus pantothenticus]QTY15503.1 hypothetical protein KBP50_16665 [Virgibacillus pantothenticus]SIT16766.1 hypothetical protein SAMN05421787_12732 [Virgibacillus pantothenticus]
MNLQEQIIQKLKEEAEFAKGCGMPQFVMGIQQAIKVVENIKDWSREDESN